MKGGKLAQIARVRLAARELHKLEHVQTCACCQYDADEIETLADAPCTPSWLTHVAKRISAITARSPTSTQRSP
jgi:hypothetical protein